MGTVAVSTARTTSHHASSAVYMRYINVTITAATAGINQFDHQLEQETKQKHLVIHLTYSLGSCQFCTTMDSFK